MCDEYEGDILECILFVCKMIPDKYPFEILKQRCFRAFSSLWNLIVQLWSSTFCSRLLLWVTKWEVNGLQRNIESDVLIFYNILTLIRVRGKKASQGTESTLRQRVLVISYGSGHQRSAQHIHAQRLGLFDVYLARPPNAENIHHLVDFSFGAHAAT